MKHPERVADYLEHIIQASSRAVDYAGDADNFEDFMRDTRTQDAVVRNIEIIGEAVTQLQKADPDFTAAHPNIPWEVMRGMRNIVVHEYFGVDPSVVWKTVRNDLPPLIEKVQFLLSLTRDPEPPGHDFTIKR